MLSSGQSKSIKEQGVRSPLARSIIFEPGSIALSVFLFYLSFPNHFSDWGFGIIGFFALFPLIRLVNRTPFWRLCIYGPLIGFLTYVFFNIWLINFHPLAIFVVPIIYALYYVFLIPLLKLPTYVLGRYAWIAQVLIWLAYEYLRTLGFLGYPYGIIGYTQYLNIPLLNLASLTGVSGVSALVLIPQFFLAQIVGRFEGGQLKAGDRSREWVREILMEMRAKTGAKLKQYKPEIIVILFLFVASVLYGVLSQVDYSGAAQVKMALVQQNVDPWIGGLRAYRNSLDASIRQTRLALEAPPIRR